MVTSSARVVDNRGREESGRPYPEDTVLERYLRVLERKAPAMPEVAPLAIVREADATLEARRLRAVVHSGQENRALALLLG